MKRSCGGIRSRPDPSSPRGRGSRDQSARAPEARTIGAHFAISVFTNAANCSGVVCGERAPSPSMRALISGDCISRITSAFSRRKISGAVPAGANNPIQLVTSKPGNAASATVGGRGRAHLADRRQRAQLAGPGVRQHRRHGGENERGLACEDVGDCGNIALVGHVHHLDFRHGLEQFAREVARGAHARRSEGERSGVCARGRSAPGRSGQAPKDEPPAGLRLRVSARSARNPRSGRRAAC